MELKYIAVWCLVGVCGASVVHQGVLFQSQGTLAFSSTTHSLGLVLDIQNVTDQLEYLSKFTQSLALIANEKPVGLTSYFTDEVTKIGRVINATLQDLDDFVTSFPVEKTRPKRFTNLAGYIVGNVLGLATDSEINDLVQQINREHTATHKVLNQVVSHLEVTDQQLDRLVKATNQVELAYRGLAHHIRKTDAVMAAMHTDIIMSQALNFLQFAAMDIQSEIAKLLGAISTQVQSQRPSPKFLAPDRFLSVLVKLQDHVKLLYPASNKFISSFYDISNVITKKIGKKFIFLVRIPLKSSEMQFDLFHLNSMWHKPPNGSDWARKLVVEDQYLAVRKDKRYSMPLPNLDTCVQSRTMTVCTPTVGFTTATAQDCLMSVFRSHEQSNTLCPFLYTRNYSPAFHKVGDGWVVTTPDVLQATEVCPDSSTLITIQPGISKLKMRDHCQVIGESFSLPAFITSQHKLQAVQVSHSYTFPALPSPHQLVETLKQLKLQHVEEFTHTQLALLSVHPQIIPHKYFPFKEVLLAVCLILCMIASAMIVRCWLKLHKHMPCCGLGFLKENRNQSSGQQGRTRGVGGGARRVINSSIPPKPTRRAPTPFPSKTCTPSPDAPRSSRVSFTDYIEMLVI